MSSKKDFVKNGTFSSRFASCMHISAVINMVALNEFSEELKINRGGVGTTVLKLQPV